MLHGLECSLFDKTAAPSPAFHLADTAWETHSALMDAFSASGRQLGVLRQFARRPQTVPHVQALQDCVARRLDRLDCHLAAVEARFASPAGDVVVSLMALMAELAPLLEAPLALSAIVARGSESLGYLQALFDETSAAQLVGKPAVFECLARTLVECLNVYLRPAQLWVSEGELVADDDLFFIAEPASRVPLGDTWQRRFSLRKTADGRVDAPRFLEAAVGDIYNAGKNIVVLRLLSRGHGVTSRQLHGETSLDYDSLCPPGFELAPFPDLLGAALDRWIRRHYRETSAALKRAMLGSWGLSASLDALRTLYLMSDGRAAATLCEGLFARLDAPGEGWHGHYSLTATAHEAFASLLDTGRLSVSFDAESRPLASRARASVKEALPRVRVHYRLPWPVQMIVTAESVAQYQSVFTLLLQIRRAMHAVHGRKLLADRRPGGDGEAERGLAYAMRHKIVWFYGALQTYLATLVLEPLQRRMRRDLEAAEDVDAMIAAHASATRQMTEQACLGSRLAPVREAMLDVLDLAVMLEHGEGGDSARALREAEVEFARLLRLICGGLRGVARASGSASAAKWDMLADMLQAGVGDG